MHACSDCRGVLPKLPGSSRQLPAPEQLGAGDSRDADVSPGTDTLRSAPQHLKPLKAKKNL